MKTADDSNEVVLREPRPFRLHDHDSANLLDGNATETARSFFGWELVRCSSPGRRSKIHLTNAEKRPLARGVLPGADRFRHLRRVVETKGSKTTTKPQVPVT
jgi:hypothetical protein